MTVSNRFLYQSHRMFYIPITYTHQHLMSCLHSQVVNAEVPVRRFIPVAQDAATISQQLSVAMAAVAMPVHLKSGSVTPKQVLIIDAVLLLLGQYESTIR